MKRWPTNFELEFGLRLLLYTIGAVVFALRMHSPETPFPALVLVSLPVLIMLAAAEAAFSRFLMGNAMDRQPKPPVSLVTVPKRTADSASD